MMNTRRLVPLADCLMRSQVWPKGKMMSGQARKASTFIFLCVMQLGVPHKSKNVSSLLNIHLYKNQNSITNLRVTMIKWSHSHKWASKGVLQSSSNVVSSQKANKISTTSCFIFKIRKLSHTWWQEEFCAVPTPVLFSKDKKLKYLRSSSSWNLNYDSEKSQT